MTDPRFRKQYCRDFCGYEGCPYVWLPGLGSFMQGTGFTEEVADEIIAALQAVPPPVEYQRFQDGKLKPFLDPDRYDDLRDDDRFLYNRGPKPEGLV